MASVRLVHVSKRYGAVEAVKDLSLTCAEGELLALLGPSGCGKTSTLRMVAGLEAISEGDLFIGDRRSNDASPRERDIAMVFEDYALYPHMRVCDNIAFPLRIRGLPRAAVEEKVSRVIAMLGLEAVRDDNVQRLSGGAQQRVSIGRAIVRDPRVLLMDEPISHLDTAHKAQLRGELKRLQGTLGVTTLYVTHDQVEAMALADRIAVMHLGVLQQYGAPRELYDRPANLFVAGFIGEPPMNLLPCEPAEGGWRLRGADLDVRVAPPARAAIVASGARRLVLGIRPPDVVLEAPPGAAAVRGEVYAVQGRGDTAIVAVRGPGGAFVLVELAKQLARPAGDAVALGFPPEHVHLFDAGTGRNLVPPPPASAMA